MDRLLFRLGWAPSFSHGSQLSILPLLWGTLYISFVALLVSVPIGLYAAIYLSEYASKPVRSVAKPLLEILAVFPQLFMDCSRLQRSGRFCACFLAMVGFWALSGCPIHGPS